MKSLLFGILLISSKCLFGQGAPDTSWKKEYRESATRINNLVHAKLDLKPDFSKTWVYGKAWITLKPHFYPTDSLNLDAKGMTINKVALVKGNNQVALKYEYDDWNLRISLDRTYRANENYTIYIDYISKPDEFEAKYGEDAMLGIKGLYFINPTGEVKNKPTQIWTQGETESNSAWFPTIDRTNQRCTQELTVTVDNKFVTLSNGKLVSQKNNNNGTHSDYWKMDLPHAPYLFFLGVGEYAVVKDKWRDKEVNYYVEKEYSSVAKKIFGNTPEMMTYFSRITGVDFPWIKYSQITGRDYVAGAMENTTATIHQETSQQDARELVDGNKWEGTIAHELFHQWFGDYVTTESWSNLTLNESFADYSETLWDEYKKRPDLVNVDANKSTLWTKKDNKTLDNYIHQYKYAGNYVDRREAIEFSLRKTDDPKAVELLKTALTDPYPALRSMTINGTDLRNETIRNIFEPLLKEIAKSDNKTTVRASAIQKLGEYKNPTHAALFKSAINDSSYSIAGNALVALSKIEPDAAAALAIQLVSKPAKGSLKAAIMEQIIKSGDESMADKLIGDFAALPLGQEKFEMIGPLKNYLTVLKNPEKVRWGVEEIVKFREAVPGQFRNQTDFIINAAIKAIATKKAKEGDSFKELVEYMKTKLPEADKKGF